MNRLEELDPNFQAAPTAIVGGIAWFTVNHPPFVVDGLPWFKENGGEFYRLPKRAKGIVRKALWDLGTMPTSGRVRFKTDSTAIHTRVQHSRPELGTPLMCSVATSGLDLYEGPPHRMTYWSSNHPTEPKAPYVTPFFFEPLTKKLREYTIYLPTYNDLVRFEIGLVPGAKLAAPSGYRRQKPVVFYGTSVTQGGCCSRGANGFVPLIGRRLGLNVINLGFSGNAFCDLALVPLLDEIDMACLVVDPVVNMGWERMQKDYIPFLQAIRARRPKLPLVLMTQFRFAHESYMNPHRWDSASDSAVQTYRQMRRAGDRNVHLIECRKFITPGPDHPSVDGIHLTDLGFEKMANGIAPILKKVLKLSCKT
ncbi:MAG: hypothetical protein PCFJNLEI_02873 [Verrucomicrobiae bacterium]|nr:hypothetical protein [Verrucomicrobiae bacterium]